MPRPVLIPARALLLLAAAAGRYGTPRSDWPGAGSGGASGNAGNAGGQGGSGGAAGTGGTATGMAGTSGGGSAGSSNPVFVGGPCVTSPERTELEVFARTSDGRVLRRAYDGNNWGDWANLPALDASLIDARSDLDCSANGPTIHLVAAGVSPIGAFLHAFGSETIYNPFSRELADLSIAPSPSVAVATDARYFLGALAIGATFPALYEFGDTPAPLELTPITTQTGSIRSGPDVALQALGGSGFRYFAAFDSDGDLAVHFHVVNSGGAHWEEPIKLSPPLGTTFTFGPAICTENGAFGISSINLVAAAAGRLWYSRSPSITSAFSSWVPITADPASSPDCTVTGSQSIVHVVTTSAAGTVLDINGKESSWVATDLGFPP